MIQIFTTSAAAEAAGKPDLSAVVQRMATPKPQASVDTAFTTAGPSVAEEKTATPEAEIPAAAEVTLKEGSATAETARV